MRSVIAIETADRNKRGSNVACPKIRTAAWQRMGNYKSDILL